MTDDPSLDSHDDLIEALRAENDALIVRIEQLEAATAEYRRQMAVVLNSVSWRMTSPFRRTAGSVRLLKRRARHLPKRLVTREQPSGASTAGLFPPVVDPVWAAEAPLLNPILQRIEGPPPEPAYPHVRTHSVLVVAHVYYPEVWLDIEDRLQRIPEAYDLIVCLVEGQAIGLEKEIVRRLPHARIRHVPNYGRDLGSLVELANDGVFEGYDAILKVHTKRSPHRMDGDSWRLELLDGVLPSPQEVRRFLELLRTDRDVGFIVPTGHLRGPETWGSDRELVEALAARLPLAFDPDALLYPAGSMYWVRPWILQRLADLRLTVAHFEPEAHHLDGSTAHALERFLGIMCTASGLDHVEATAVPSRLQRLRRTLAKGLPDPRILAFYLPQYHRTPENDEFWGEGFTDWVNVDKAVPLFEGHRQPLVPGELGRYDLSQPDVMRKQAQLALEHGLSGFVMHYYWFDGRKVLDTPLNNLLADPSIDFPFALCWANEPWTRTWDGLDSEVLIEQRYPEGWADRFYDDVRPAMRDPRYLRAGGLPLLVVYRIGHLDDPRAAIARWKQRAVADGLGGLHVLAVVPSRDFESMPAGLGGVLDGLVRFPPGSGIGLHSVRDLAPELDGHASGDVYSYDAAVDGADLSPRGPHGLRVHPGVMPGWDNTARRGAAAYAFHGANPLSFRRWSAAALDAARSTGTGEALVFMNAWNEWAEGASLEPDARFGHSNLRALASLLRHECERPTDRPNLPVLEDLD